MPDSIKAFPPVLWAMGFFFLCLGFTAPIDIPLALFATTAAIAFNQQNDTLGWRELAKAHWPLGFFLAIAIVTTTASINPRHSLGVQPQLLPALLAYCVIARFITTPARQQFFCAALLASGLLTASLMLLGVYSSTIDDPLERVKLLGNALFIVPNDILMLSVIAPLTLTLAWHGGICLRLLVGLYLLLTLLASAVISSRQSVLIFLLGQSVFFAFMTPRWFIPIFVLGAAAGAIMDWLLGWPLANKILMFPRTYVWHTAWIMFLDQPWLGQGPGMFKDLYFPFLEKAGYVVAELGDRRNMPWAHSLYLEQLAERGILGLLALLALMATAIKQAWNFSYTHPSEHSSKSGLSAGLLGSLVSLSLAGIAEATLSRLWVTVILLSLAGLCTTLRQGPHKI